MGLIWTMEIDFLLIGQGLAGTALAYRLEQAGKKVVLLDQPEKNISSRVAAGLYNPVTGKKMVKSWIAEKLFPELESFYEELEAVLDRKFLIKKKIYRPFLSIEEQNEWMGHSSDPLIHLFIEKIYTESQFQELKDPYGGVLLKKSGWLDIKTYLDDMGNYFGERLKIEPFEERLLQKTDAGWQYKDLFFQGIIFCNGLGARNSRFFDFLPFAPVKGEILEVEQDFSPEWIINRGVFRVPLEPGVFRVGSTYTWHDLDVGPTESAKNELINKLENLIHTPVKNIRSHRHGIRPATRDRKPFLGKHPKEDGVYIFNGFGAKGVSLIPYFSAMMRDFLVQNRPLDSEVDIKRYFNYI
jgi:glycine oxidase